MKQSSELEVETPGLTQSLLEVKVKGQGQRRRRNTANSEQFKLVGKNREDISPVKYTVQVAGQEPKEAFVSPPAESTLNTNLQSAGTSTCGCTPKAEGQVTLVGKTPTTEKTKIQNALDKAVLKENSLQTGDLTVAIVTIEDSTDNKNDVSTLTYQVTCINTDVCEIESLHAPSKVVLEKELGDVGKTLYSTAEPVPEEEDKNKWLIPVAIACGVVLFIIILLVICCIMYRKRHQKKGDFVQQEEEVKVKNNFDREHFSDAAVFHNEAFVEGGTTTFKL